LRDSEFLQLDGDEYAQTQSLIAGWKSTSARRCSCPATWPLSRSS
jgi:hypothetical protein